MFLLYYIQGRVMNDEFSHKIGLTNIKKINEKF